ncbi:MAG: hypothetical protein IKH30_12900 [Clostridia bacterium]|nr:hypothetical protein [Clostridia bacterium]
MKYILQIFTGPWHAANHKPEEVIEKIGAIASRIAVDKVIIGWSTDASAYQKIGAFLHGLGIKMLLWLPVFSEVSEVSEPDQAMDLFGKPVIPPIHQPGEDFLFGCPSSRRNVQIVKDIYARFFSDCGFDGVFLDKIRGQSFLAGVSGVLSCGCGNCRKAFLNKGVNIGAVRKDYENRKDDFFDMAAYPMNGNFVLKDTLAQRFFEAKEEIIADAVAELCQYFKSKGLIVGLDLFAPVISRFVGQNYSLLTKHADFIKPMLYRKTTAPAGIGYEYALFKKYAPNAQGRIKIQMDQSFLDTQLEAISQAACEKYPGIEINYRENIARTDVRYITESLAAVKSYGLDGAALCWNVMLAPEAHIDAIARMENDH